MKYDLTCKIVFQKQKVKINNKEKERKKKKISKAFDKKFGIINKNI